MPNRIDDFILPCNSFFIFIYALTSLSLVSTVKHWFTCRFSFKSRDIWVTKQIGLRVVRWYSPGDFFNSREGLSFPELVG